MNDESKLVRGRFIRRYKRFFADVELEDGSIVTAHCPNTGSMATLLEAGVAAWLTPAADPSRKLRWTLTLLGTRDGGQALVDTAMPNRLVREAVDGGRIASLVGYPGVKSEVKYGEQGSRVDLALFDREGDVACYVEVKNVTMASSRHGHRADFPDAVTERGRKHLEELEHSVRSGVRAVLFFHLGRTDRDACGFAAEIDPSYAEAALRARDAGVEFIAHRIAIDGGRISLGSQVPVEWD